MQSRKIIANELKSELMLYDTIDDTVHLLNKTARRIYELHRAGNDVAGIEREMRQSFQIGHRQDLRAHVVGCLDDLREKKIID